MIDPCYHWRRSRAALFRQIASCPCFLQIHRLLEHKKVPGESIPCPVRYIYVVHWFPVAVNDDAIAQFEAQCTLDALKEN